jgi:membrane associated rhomboid family serine protease
MSSSADLFVVCKQCGSEVSPYITECPYCGSRLRKRAPKLEKARRQRERVERRAEARLGRLRPGEMPGIRPEGRPYAMIALVLASIAGPVLWRAGAVAFGDLAVGDNTLVGQRWWHVLTAPFVYHNNGYMLVALGAIALFGWLLERRHGPLAVLLLFAAGGAGGMLVASALETGALVAGGGEDTDSDLRGLAVIAAALFLLPLAVEEADPLAGLTGALAGLALGWPLAALHRIR